MSDGNYFDEKEEDSDDDSSPNLYSILNLSRDANQEEIHRSYRSLSTTFHPDKIQRRPIADGETLDTEEIQETFLRFKKAHDVLIDPVLRLAYDFYGGYGVELVRRIQQQQRDQKTRRDRRNSESNEEADNEGYDGDGGYDDEEDDEEGGFNLYERLENLLVEQKNVSKARTELDQFMEQHDYQQNLTEDNYVHLNVSMTFPPAVPLKPVLFKGRDYLRHVQKSVYSNPPADAEEKQYFKQRVLQEGRIVDYQISQMRSSQKADLGFTLSSVQPPRNNQKNKGNHISQKQIQPSKWSMAIGCNTDLIYPGVAEIANMANAIKSKKKQEEYQEMAQKHPVSAFVNTSYTPNPQTQVFWTANVNNDNESHQYSMGSTHTFSTQTACRYGMTYLARSPFPDEAPIIFNLKSYRHLQNIGTTSVGVSASSSGQMLQWNAKWEGTKTSKIYRFVHKASIKGSIGMLQGNSVEFGYKCKLPKPHDDEAWSAARESSNQKNLYEWLEEMISLPKNIEITATLGRFQKVAAMVTHELTSLATNPTLGFGMEHDVSLGRWAWIWEIQYNQSTFRIPISILQLGSVVDHRRFYAQRFYYGIYCLLMQSMVADLLKDNDDDEDDRKMYRDLSNPSELTVRSTTISEKGGVVKTKTEAEKQAALMNPVAEKKRYRELQLQKKQEIGGGGLVILGATYWQKFSQKSNHESNNNNEDAWMHEIISMDATDQLQFWVKESRLSIPSRLPKSSWMGFYSLHTESKLFLRHQRNPMPKQRWWSYGREQILNLVHRWTQKENHLADSSSLKHAWQDPQLTVRYSFRGSVFEISVGDTESLELPCEDGIAEKLGDADYVQ